MHVHFLLLWKDCLLTSFPIRSLWFSMTPQGGIPTVHIFLKHWEEWAFRASPTCLDTPMNNQFRSQALTHKSCKTPWPTERDKQTSIRVYKRPLLGKVADTVELVSVSWLALLPLHLLLLSLISWPEQFSSPYGYFCLQPRFCPYTSLTTMSRKPSPEIMNVPSGFFSDLLYCSIKTFCRCVPCLIEAN